MSEHTSRRFRVALHDEIMQWQQEGLVSGELATNLLTRYPILSQGNRAATIAMVLGAVLLGLGAILFGGSNWEHMARIAKVGVIVSAILASYIVGWVCKFEPGNHPKLGSALFLTGSLLYGAGIWLISQIFNFDTGLTEGLLLWSLGTSALAYITRSRLVTILLAILVPAWNLSQYYDPAIHNTYFNLPIGNIWTFIPSMIAAACLCVYSRSRAAMYVLAIGGLIWAGILSGGLWSGLLIFSALLFTAHIVLRERWEAFANPLLYTGAAGGLCACLLATFDKTGAAVSISNFTSMAVFLVLAMGMAAYANKGRNEFYSETIGCLGFAIAGGIITEFAADFTKLFLTNGLLVALIAGVIAAGVRLQKPGLINLAIVFAVLDIIFRYFDMFFSMMDRSIFFMLGGLVLIVAGSIAEKNRRRLTSTFS